MDLSVDRSQEGPGPSGSSEGPEFRDRDGMSTRLVFRGANQIVGDINIVGTLNVNNLTIQNDEPAS